MFKVGDKILCINDEPVYSDFKIVRGLLKKGDMYTVRSPVDFCACGTRILLEEVEAKIISNLTMYGGFIYCFYCRREKVLPIEEIGLAASRFVKMFEEDTPTEENEEWFIPARGIPIAV